MKFKVTYEHEVVITYEAIVEADSIEDAKDKVYDGAEESETEMEYQGVEKRILDVEKI